jgi:hypothetical protein
MRKTLTVFVALAAAGSLAACKPFWTHDEEAAKPPAATGQTGQATDTITPTPKPTDAEPSQSATAKPIAPPPEPTKR